MKRLILTATFTVAVSVPGVATAKLSHSEAVKYGRAYGHVVHLHGRQAAGCKLIGPNASCRRVTDDMVRHSTEVLHRMLAPAPRPVYHAVVTHTSTTSYAASSYSSASSGACGGITPYSGGGSCWAIPYSIVQCESGGSYSAHNPSGASGAYQLMSGGGGSKSEQDQAAARLYAGGAGRGNWVC